MSRANAAGSPSAASVRTVRSVSLAVKVGVPPRQERVDPTNGSGLRKSYGADLRAGVARLGYIRGTLRRSRDGERLLSSGRSRAARAPHQRIVTCEPVLAKTS